MPTIPVKLRLSKQVLNVKLLYVEGIDCLSAIRPTGSGWDCSLPKLSLGTDGDIDIFVFVEGWPQTKCTLSVTIGNGAAESFEEAFDDHGNTYFNVAVDAPKGSGGKNA
jgi:hypothetical protein